MGEIDEIKLSIESEDFAQRRTGRKGTSYYNGLAAGYREGYRKRASEGKETPDENGNCIKPDVIKSVCPLCNGKGEYSFGGSFGSTVQTVRCPCGANGL